MLPKRETRASAHRRRRRLRRGGSTPPAAAITTRRVPQPRCAPTDVDRRLRASVAPFAVPPSERRWFGFNNTWCAKHPRVVDNQNIQDWISIRRRRSALNQKRGFESAPSLTRWRIARPIFFFPLVRPRKLTNTIIENARRPRDALIPTGPQSHRETATTMTGKVTGKVRSMTDPTPRASRPPSCGDLRDDGECDRTGALARESMNFPGAS